MRHDSRAGAAADHRPGRQTIEAVVFLAIIHPIMNWLLRSILGDSVSLTPAQLKSVTQLARKHAANEKSAWLLSVLPGMLPLLAIPFWQRLRNHLPLGWYVACEVGFAVGVLALIGFLIRRQLARYAWRAVRELGLADVCGRCGYSLVGRATDQPRCPECGEAITPFGASSIKSDDTSR